MEQYPSCSAKAGREPSPFVLPKSPYRTHPSALNNANNSREPPQSEGRAPLQASVPSQPPNSPAHQASYPRSRRGLPQDCRPVQGLFEVPMLLFVETPQEAVGNTARSRSLLARHELEQSQDLFGLPSDNTRWL